MSRVFLSHSSHDSLEAVALKRWLVAQEPGLAQEIFLDLDPHTGLAPGERWKEALQRANARCEAVICLLSARWEVSAECRVEYRSAETLGKLIFCARLEPEATGEVTAQWQRCDLFGPGPVTEVPVELEGTSTTVVFRTEGLERLLLGLRRAGVGAEYFPWPPPDDPDRAPYRGWAPLEEADAAVFFGRDTAILRGLDALRGMRTTGTASLFVILGPSGVGKSSFLRAGLLPRLRRDDRHFVVLELMRPEQAALTGDKGFAAALHRTRNRLGLKTPALGAIKAACTAGDTAQLRAWVAEVRQVAAKRLPNATADVPVPTVVLPVDQAEELFSVDAGAEAPRFLELLAELVRTEAGTTPGLIVAETIRADLYEPLQTAPALAQVRSVVFDDLRPLPRAEFKDVITGPAERATAAGRALELEPALVDRLLIDSDQGADTLPLLALTLARLYRDYGATGILTLEAYAAMGGMGQVVQSEINALLAQDPAVRQAQLELLRAAFVPWLATINPDNDQLVRRAAHIDDLPVASRPLIEAMVQARLLVQDTREGTTVIEVALESLLRQWEDLVRWLAIERRNLIEADALERTATAWEDHQHDEAWLLQGQRLLAAETLTATPHFTQRLRTVRPFLETSRQREDERAAAEQRRQEAELHTARDKAAMELKAREQAQAHATVLKKRSRVLKKVLTATLVVAMAAVVGFALALQARREADDRTREATALRLTAEGQAMLAGARPGGDVRAIQQLLIAEGLHPSVYSQGGVAHGIAARFRLEKLIDSGSFVAEVGFSRDGSRIVSGGEDGTVRVWDAGTGEPVGEPLTGHEDGVRSVGFSPDGNRIVSGGEDGTVRVWDTGTGKPVGEPLTGHEDWVDSVEFSPDGTRIVSGSWDGTVRVWDTDTGEAVGPPIVSHEEGVMSVGFSPDGTQIVSGGLGDTVRVWDTSNGQPMGEPLTGHTGEVRSVGFSPDGTQIISGSGDGTVRVWDANTGEAVRPPIVSHEEGVMGVGFSPDGTRIVSGGLDSAVRLWDASTGKPVGDPLTGHRGVVTSVGFSPDGTRVFSGGEDGTVRSWELREGEPLIDDEFEVSSVGFNLNGTRVVSASYDGMIRVWDASTRELVAERFTDQEQGVSSMGFSPDGTRMLSSSGLGGMMRVWDVGTGELVREWLTGHEDGMTSMAFSPDGTRVASTGGYDGIMQVWDVGTGELVREWLTGHEEGVSSVAFSPDGTRAVTGGAFGGDGMMRVWDVGTGELVREWLTGQKDGVTSMAFSPDGTRIASGGFDGTMRVWDADTGNPSGQKPIDHGDAVRSAAFSHDGTWIVSGSQDGTVQVWDAGTGEPVGEPLIDHGNGDVSVTFSPEGTWIVSGGPDGRVRLWPGPAAWRDLLCAKLTRNMSHEQWRVWVSPTIDYLEACPRLPRDPVPPS